MVATPIPTIAVMTDESLTLSQKVEKWTWQLCRALEEDYKQYHTALGAESKNLIKFRMEFGRKYIKIIQQDYDTFQDRNEYRDGGVHAFVDRNTGEVYKPASWKGPAKGVRFDMRIINDRAKLHDPYFVDWAGGYLYMR